LNPDAPAALLIAPESPYPVRGGGALRTASLLHYLARSRPVDLIVFRQPGAADPRDAMPPGLVRRLAVIPLPPNGRGLPARALRNAARAARRIPPLVDRFSGFEPQLREALAGHRYQVGVIEHSWCAPYQTLLADACERTALNLHNVESVLHQRCASSDGAASGWAHRVFARASRKLEREWFPRFDFVLAPSAEDAALVAKLSPAARVRLYPNAIPWAPLPQTEGEEALVFSGNMEYHPNRTAVAFFRREVWPALRSRFPQLVWRLAGKNPAAVRPWTAGDDRIQVLGPMDDAVAELARARIAIVPLLAGSGTRFKILEAWAAGLPVVSTAIGAEGLPVRDGEHILIANGAAAFTAAVTRLLASQALRTDLGRAGRCLLEKEFTWENAWKCLDF
jgi:polysaccharide biosynthesis protein PslH